ncbi:MAG: DNA-directed RNA polymerase subunit omega [Candidatus Omnitrophica bacterium CG12_big_fil_rev_8_21_14_0_65_50_5]|nr:MAG: DNA-directed RNA polymerase subunit omega [Candidatus Omnitrophica bacterium CG12_big_fil_rev_8_21_14_0_65_50_5]
MLVKQPLEELLKRSEHSVYRLVRMASQRALELSDGKPSLVPHTIDAKVTTIALEEIRLGKVEAKIPTPKKR